MEAIRYVEKNEHGSMVVTGTNSHVEAIGFAHEGGSSDAELIEWFHLDKEQLYGALAYFYGNRDTILASEEEAAGLAKEFSDKGANKLKEWRKKQAR